MNELKVRLVVLEPMRVAAARGFGTSPEETAWQKLRHWASFHAHPSKLTDARFFGFNNPSPSASSQDYGYEQWMTVDAAAIADGEVEIKDFPGGRYAVTRCRLAEMVESWQSLAGWCLQNSHPLAGRHELEECLTPELFLPEFSPNAAEALFDLYAPIEQ